MAVVQDRFTQAISSNFLNLSGEKLILATRKHWFMLAIPLVITGIVSFTLIILSSFLLLFAASYSTLFFSIFIVILLFTLTFGTKLVVDWYFHIYLVTSRKVVEVCYSPLFSHKVNDILLDQVRCTEVDAKIEGIINELLDLGDVTITFDRPTHQEVFELIGISSPKKTGIFLGDALIFEKRENVSQLWYKKDEKNTQSPDGKQKNKFRLIEEIFPGPRNVLGA